MLQVYGEVPPAAVRVVLYGLLTTPCGNAVVEMVREEEMGVFAAAMTTGTACESCIVCVFWTCNWTVAGVVRLLLPIVPDNVLASTTVVVSAAPFQRMAAWAGKFVPVTLNVVV